MPTLLNPNEYLNHILKNVPEDGKKEILKEAYKNALDTRKFEIELYWKRATYFWAFIAAIFVALYSVVNNNENSKILFEKPLLGKRDLFVVSLAITIALLGFLFSLGWFFVNRGSKVWQKNWEKHIDLLEDKMNGPLFKTVVKPNLNFWELNSYFPYSVSKVNLTLSFIVVIFWLVVTNALIYSFVSSINHTACTIALGLIIANLLLALLGYWFHIQSLSFMYKDWKKGRKSIRTYIDID